MIRRVWALSSPQDDVNAGLPWSVLDDQGAYSTIYVSSFTSHESVNKIYEYGNILEGTGQARAGNERYMIKTVAVTCRDTRGIL